ncbi:MAG: hypothetical protein N3H30_01920 [Candidatus Micrarchaeota archaeon]|nr:hypothetical protein [Candidatus Micrarchaeota archaeon]
MPEEVTVSRDNELTSKYSTQLESAQKLANEIANTHEIEIQLRFVNGTLQAYVRCSEGSTKCNDNNLAELTKNFAKGFASKFSDQNENAKAAAFAGLAFVDGGATAEQVEKVSKLSNGELANFNEQMKSKFETATVKLGDAAAQSEKAGGEGQAENLGRQASLISRDEISKFLENARIWGIDHLKKDEQLDEELFKKVKKKGGKVDEAGVATRVEGESVTIAIATTGTKGGVGERKSMFKLTTSKENLGKIVASAPDVCKSLSEDLVNKDGTVNAKALKEYLYVHRNEKKVGDTIRKKMIEIFGKEEYEKMEAEAQRKYAEDYPGKKMSKTGFAIALFYAAVTAEEKKTAEKKADEDKAK